MPLFYPQDDVQEGGRLRFLFGENLLDVDRRELRRQGQPVALEPQVFDLLLFLIRNRDRVVSKDDIISHVWVGRAVSDSALATRLNGARNAVGDDGATQRIIRTFPRKGLRFVADVKEDDGLGPADLIRVQVNRRKPRIAVIPLANLSGDSRGDYIADGITEEIVTAIMRMGKFSVVVETGRPSGEGRAPAIHLDSHERGMQYVVCGSVRTEARRIRISTRMYDTAIGTYLWANREDGSLAEVLGLQDRVAASVCAALGQALLDADLDIVTVDPRADLNAYTLCLRAQKLYASAAGRVPEAKLLLEEAVRRAPGYAPALGWAAVCCFRAVSDGRSTDPEADRRAGIGFAAQALAAASDDATSLANAAQTLAFFGEDCAAMLKIIDCALGQNPKLARAWFSKCAVHVFAGQTDLALEHASTTRQLMPGLRLVPLNGLVGMAHFLARRFEEAVPALLVAVEEDTSYPQPYRYLAASYAHMDRAEKAGGIIRRLRHITPTLIPDTSYLRRPEHRELYAAGLARAVEWSNAA